MCDSVYYTGDRRSCRGLSVRHRSYEVTSVGFEETYSCVELTKRQQSSNFHFKIQDLTVRSLKKVFELVFSLSRLLRALLGGGLVR